MMNESSEGSVTACELCLCFVVGRLKWKKTI